MTWTQEQEEKVAQIFERAFASSEAKVMEMCRLELLELGLSERQIDNGFMAGALSLALISGIDQYMTDLFKEFQRTRPEDAEIVLRSIDMRKTA